MIYLIGGSASFIAANVLGWVADRYGKLRVFMYCVFLSVLLVYVITNVPAIPFVFILVLFGFWFAFSTGRGVTAQAMISNVVAPEKRGSFMSFNSSVQQLGTSIAALMSGAIVTRGVDGKIQHYEWVGYLSIVVLLLCAGLARMIFRRSDEKVTAPVIVVTTGKE